MDVYLHKLLRHSSDDRENDSEAERYKEEEDSECRNED